MRDTFKVEYVKTYTEGPLSGDSVGATERFRDRRSVESFISAVRGARVTDIVGDKQGHEYMASNFRLFDLRVGGIEVPL